MAISRAMATITSKVRQTILSTHKLTSTSLTPFCNSSFYSTSTFDYTSDLDELPLPNSGTESPELGSSSSSSSSSSSTDKRDDVFNHPTILEGGLDPGIFKAMIVGQVGQKPFQKTLRNGKRLTLTTVGTGGIRNERIPFPSEEPREYADRCNVQWHRVSVYPDRMGDILFKHAQPGAILYLEGNLETKIYTDPATGLIRRIREIAIRRNGRIVFLGNGGDFSPPSPNELKGIGYF